MMGVVAPEGLDVTLLERFRSQARDGRHAKTDPAGHGDGWGITCYVAGRPFHVGRSEEDAAVDPLYRESVAYARKLQPRGVVLAHVRQASLGRRHVENSHPFHAGSWAFCHNGTVFGLAEPGENDSRALFAAIRKEMSHGADPVEAIHKVAHRVDGDLRYTSMTFLLTDGNALYAFRKVGNDPEECAPAAFPEGYFTLGYARIGQSLVVSQEHEFLGLGADAWTSVPDGHLLVVDAQGETTLRQVF